MTGFSAPTGSGSPLRCSGRRDAGAIGEDATVLDIADAVVSAFGDLDAAGGLTKGQLAGALADLIDGDSFKARLDHLVRAGMPVPVRDRTHQVRYLLSPESATSMLVWERLAREGGLAELTTLLDRTADGLRVELIDPSMLVAHLDVCGPAGRCAARHA